MGLFDRIFGNKNQEATTEETKSTEEVALEEVSEGETVEEIASSADVVAEHKLSDEASQENLEQDENLSPELPEESLEAEPEATKIMESTEVEIDEKQDDDVQMADSEIDTEESNAALAAMEAYYQRKADLEKQLADGVFEENEIVTPAETIQEESQEEKYQRSLSKTRTGFSARLNSFFANFRRVDEEFFEELEEMLILSDVGVTVATRLTDELRQEAKLENAKKPETLKRVIVEKLVEIYEKDGIYNEKINYQNGLTVMLFVGVNGVGKTTSIGKLAYRYKAEGKKVMMVAADTFRAGAVAQLAEWGRRVDVPVVMGPEKADPASVVFDGVERAVAEACDILLIDTAGRLQNKENLMAELEKMGRIIKRVLPDAPHETLLALDASTGQNALSQAKEFSKIMPLTGLILTKIDGSAKGGVVLAIRQELDIPVKFIGFGEKIDDIGEFQSEDFMRGLLGELL